MSLRLIWLLLLCTSIPASAAAQDGVSGQGSWVPTVTLKAGLLAPTLDSENPAEDIEVWNAPYFAIGFGGRQTNRFEVASEIAWSRKGGRTKLSRNRGYAHWEFLGVELPVLIRMNVGDSRGPSGFLVAGPSLDFRIRHRLLGEDGFTWRLHHTTPFLGVNAVLGAGLAWDRVSLDVRWHHGVRGLMTQPDVFLRDPMKTRTIVFALGYRLFN